MKRRGFWLFDIENSFDKDLFKNTVHHVLEILITNKIFIPRIIYYEKVRPNIAIPNGLTLSQMVGFIFDNAGYLRGDTVLNENIIMDNVFTFDFDFRNPGFNMTLYTNSDIWLPMMFNEDTYSFYWNLEQYYLNYNRLPKVLHEIQKVLNWDNDSSKEKDYTERGCIQVGYDLFLSEEVITREYIDNPNPNFDLKAYLQKIKESESKISSI